ncbi:MAG TPA: tRNA lysidine(34) synthetase TilS [Nitrospirota bacterium]|nr:tRNA lysidine(34) synthetase TilS [Nitrospirota bacterium]
MLLVKVKLTIERFGMLKPGERVLVAVSGGPDSVCLLSALRALSAELGVSLHIAHLDHMFRGRESADESLFVARLAEKLGTPVTIEQLDVPSFCRERGMSSQAGAREVRYGFLHRVAETIGASRIATGHTADDQAETFLMRLLRGAGVAGLSAIPPVRDNIIRPLIEVTRKDVLEYLQSNGLEYVSDLSNIKPVYTRNRIRMEVLPVLKRFNPRLVETLASTAALLRDEDEAAEACLSTMAAGVIVQEENHVALNREEFNALPQAYKRRMIRKAVTLAVADSGGLSSVQVGEVIAFMAAAQTGRAMRMPYGLIIEREYEKFVIRFGSAVEGFSHTLKIPGVTLIPELGMEVEAGVFDYIPVETNVKNYRWQALFDYDKIGPLLMIRNRRSGDWFCPAGMGGKSKKLQDYFVDAKIPRQERDSVPILLSGNDVLWVVGRRTDNRFLPGKGTKRVLVVQVRREE